MMFRTHLIFALFFYILFIKLFSQPFIIALATALLLGSAMPDIDSTGSWINRKARVTKLVAALSGHRGFWHSIFGLLIFFIIAGILTALFKISFLYAHAFGSGYLLHLLADSITVTGINWFWKSGKLKGFIKTGSLGENLFFVTLCIMIFLLIFGINLKSISFAIKLVP